MTTETVPRGLRQVVTKKLNPIDLRVDTVTTV